MERIKKIRFSKYNFESRSNIRKSHDSFIYFWLHWVFGAQSLALKILTVVASLVAEHRLSSCKHIGLVAPQHVKSSPTKDQTYVPCIGNWILNHWTTREAQKELLGNFFLIIREYYDIYVNPELAQEESKQEEQPQKSKQLS